MEATRSWNDFKTYDEANMEFRLLPEDQGYVLRVDKMDDPTQSPFVDLDDKGNPKPPAWQSLVTFTVVDYINDEPGEKTTVVGQQIKQFFKISMHTKANFYKMVKAAFGGDVNPSWKPNPAEVVGRVMGAVIAHKEPNEQGKVFPKVASFLPYRGNKDYSGVVAVQKKAEEADDIPF